MTGISEKTLIHAYGGLTFGVEKLCRHGSIEGRCDRCDPYRKDPLVAHARSTDPQTSHDAAASQDHIAHGQFLVLTMLERHGPITDETLVSLLQDVLSPSGIRTRRSELVAAGKVYDTGRTEVLKSGRRGTVWGAR